MKLLSISISFLLLTWACNKSPNAATQGKVGTRRQEPCDTFDLQKLFKADLWYGAKQMKSVDSVFFEKNLLRFPEFSYNKNSKSVYYYCKPNLPPDIFGQTFIQRLHNHEEINIFLLYGEAVSSRLDKLVLLAKVQKAPDDFMTMSSHFLDPEHIESISVYVNADDNESYKDSVVSRFTFRDKVFTRSVEDSVRVRLE
jgi:hypothetical protein